MIPSYNDHSANERTFLAWVRTSISIMVFGFIIERFDLFLASIKADLGNQAHVQINQHSHIAAELVGFGLFGLGAALLVLATIQYHHVQISIDKEEILPYRLRYYSWLMSGLLVLCGVFLIGYVAYSMKFV